ncbi:parafibromin-like [Rhipicephalus microplus]|uniref:parafibromin-like n=1 Tax=Rhipicephalus microplus TaxID=6941 RepID=UPI003F6D8096
MANPLSLLRQFNVNKKYIAENNSHIIFDQYSWPKTAKTNYITWGPWIDGAPREYYTLECLLFFLKNQHLPHYMYMEQAAVSARLTLLDVRSVLVRVLYDRHTECTRAASVALVRSVVLLA